MNKIWSKMAAAVKMTQQPTSDPDQASTVALNQDRSLQQPIASNNTLASLPSSLGMPVASTVVMKEVLLLTPVLLTNDDLQTAHHPKKHAYQHGQQLTLLPPLPTLHNRHDGYIIDMPLEDISNYL